MINQLKEIMKQEGITQTELAKRMNVAIPNINAILRGVNVPSIGKYQKLVKAIGWSIKLVKNED